MTYIKFILLVIGLIFIMYAKATYTKRINLSKEHLELAYNQKEKYIAWIGYILLGLAALLAAFNI